METIPPIEKDDRSIKLGVRTKSQKIMNNEIRLEKLVIQCNLYFGRMDWLTLSPMKFQQQFPRCLCVVKQIVFFREMQRTPRWANTKSKEGRVIDTDNGQIKIYALAYTSRIATTVLTRCFIEM